MSQLCFSEILKVRAGQYDAMIVIVINYVTVRFSEISKFRAGRYDAVISLYCDQLCHNILYRDIAG